MALSAKFGTFELSTSTGNQAVTGVGFQPDLVIFFGAILDISSDEVGDGSIFHFGAAMSSSARWCAGATCRFNQTTTETQKHFDSDECIVIYSSAKSTGVVVEADFVSMDSDGFTINLSTAFGAARDCHYLALAGVNFDVGTFDLTTGASDQAVTGVGFLPDALLLGCASTNVTEGQEDVAQISIGFASSTTARVSMAGWSADGEPTSNTTRSMDTGAILQQITSDVSFEIDLASFDSDGFTLGKTTKPGATTRIGYIALNGISADVDTFTSATSTGSQSITGVGFQPEVLLLLGSAETSIDAIGDTLSFLVGGATGASSEGSARIADQDTQGTTNNLREMENDAISILRSLADKSVSSKADFTSFDSDGFTLNWSVSDGSARYHAYLALKGPTGGTETEKSFTDTVFLKEDRESALEKLISEQKLLDDSRRGELEKLLSYKTFIDDDRISVLEKLSEKNVFLNDSRISELLKLSTSKTFVDDTRISERSLLSIDSFLTRDSLLKDISKVILDDIFVYDSEATEYTPGGQNVTIKSFTDNIFIDDAVVKERELLIGETAFLMDSFLRVHEMQQAESILFDDSKRAEFENIVRDYVLTDDSVIRGIDALMTDNFFLSDSETTAKEEAGAQALIYAKLGAINPLGTRLNVVDPIGLVAGVIFQRRTQ